MASSSSTSARASAAPGAARRPPRARRRSRKLGSSSCMSSLAPSAGGGNRAVRAHRDALLGLRRLILLADRHDAQHDATLAEVLVRDALDVSGGHRLRLPVIDLELRRIVVVRLSFGELRGLVEVRLQTAQELKLCARLRALQLYIRRSFPLEAIDDRVCRQLELRERVARARRDSDAELADV